MSSLTRSPGAKATGRVSGWRGHGGSTKHENLLLTASENLSVMSTGTIPIVLISGGGGGGGSYW